MPKWIKVLQEKFGIYAILATIIGVPTMIAFISSIWNALDKDNQIIAVTSGSVFLILVIIFFYFQSKSHLILIPKLLRKMHKRMLELSSEINLDSISSEDIKDTISLTDFDFSKIKSLLLVTDIKSLVTSIPDVVKLAEDASKNPNPQIVWRFHKFFFESIGLEKKLKDDTKIFGRLKKQLDNIKIPNEEIQRAIFNCEYQSEIIGTWLPLLTSMNIGVFKTLLPLPQRMDGKIQKEELNNQWNISLANAVNAIEKYYKGK